MVNQPLPFIQCFPVAPKTAASSIRSSLNHRLHHFGPNEFNKWVQKIRKSLQPEFKKIFASGEMIMLGICLSNKRRLTHGLMSAYIASCLTIFHGRAWLHWIFTYQQRTFEYFLVWRCSEECFYNPGVPLILCDPSFSFWDHCVIWVLQSMFLKSYT